MFSLRPFQLRPQWIPHRGGNRSPQIDITFIVSVPVSGRAFHAWTPSAAVRTSAQEHVLWTNMPFVSTLTCRLWLSHVRCNHFYDGFKPRYYKYNDKETFQFKPNDVTVASSSIWIRNRSPTKCSMMWSTRSSVLLVGAQRYLTICSLSDIYGCRQTVTPVLCKRNEARIIAKLFLRSLNKYSYHMCTAPFSRCKSNHQLIKRSPPGELIR